MDDSVTVTHFSLDSWGKIQQKTTPFTPKVANKPQNPLNPFNCINEETVAETNNELNNTNNNTDLLIPEESKSFLEETKISTNPFIDSNPFLDLGLNPFDTDFCTSLVSEKEEEIKVEDKLDGRTEEKKSEKKPETNNCVKPSSPIPAEPAKSSETKVIKMEEIKISTLALKVRFTTCLRQNDSQIASLMSVFYLFNHFHFFVYVS